MLQYGIVQDLAIHIETYDNPYLTAKAFFRITLYGSANDLSAYGVRLCLYRKGIRVPDDISLVGFDDLPGSSYTTPPLTTIRQPLYDIGRIATEALLGLINGEAVQAAIPPLELIVRETTRRIRCSG